MRRAYVISNFVDYEPPLMSDPITPIVESVSERYRHNVGKIIPFTKANIDRVYIDYTTFNSFENEVQNINLTTGRVKQENVVSNRIKDILLSIDQSKLSDERVGKDKNIYPFAYLQELAKNLGISSYSTLKKGILVAKIKDLLIEYELAKWIW